MYIWRMRNEDKHQELQQLVEITGLSGAENLLRIHRRTLRRWLDGQTRIPDSAIISLRAASLGQMPGRKREQAWNGWYFADGRLWSPEEVWFEPAELRALPYLRGELQALRAEVERLRQDLARATQIAAAYDPAANEADGGAAVALDKLAQWPGR